MDVCCETYDSNKYKGVPYIDSVAVRNDEKREVTVFVLNRSLDDDIEVALDFSENVKPIEHITMAGFGLKDTNTATSCKVVPSSRELKEGSVKLDKASWNVLRYKF